LGGRAGGGGGAVAVAAAEVRPTDRPNCPLHVDGQPDWRRSVGCSSRLTNTATQPDWQPVI